MNENENNFESLRRLLALKRHETPPPGYFNNFSSQVLQRIRAGQADTSANLRRSCLAMRLGWQNCCNAFDAKPVFAGAFAGALCLLLLFGIVYAERPDFTPQPLLQADNSSASLAAVTPTALSQPADQIGDCVQHQSSVQSSAGGFALRTAKSARPAGQLFTVRRQLIRFETRCALETAPRLSLNRAGANQSHRGRQPKRRRGQDHHRRQSCRLPRRAGPARAPV